MRQRKCDPLWTSGSMLELGANGPGLDPGLIPITQLDNVRDPHARTLAKAHFCTCMQDCRVRGRAISLASKHSSRAGSPTKLWGRRRANQAVGSWFVRANQTVGPARHLPIWAWMERAAVCTHRVFWPGPNRAYTLTNHLLGRVIHVQNFYAIFSLGSWLMSHSFGVRWTVRISLMLRKSPI